MPKYKAFHGIFIDPNFNQLRQIAKALADLDDETIAVPHDLGDWLSMEEASISVAVDKEDQVMGFIAVLDIDSRDESKGFDMIDTLFVMPDARRKGIGSKLIEEIKKDFDCLNLYVAQENTPAIDTYASNNFEPLALLPNHGGVGLHHWHMRWTR